MAKPSRGGQRARGPAGMGRRIGAGGVGSFMAPPPQQTQQAPPQPQQQPPIPSNATPPSITQQQFMQMDNAQTIQYLGNLSKNVKMPPSAELPEFDTQRLTYDMGLNGKPTIVSEAEFNKIKGTTIYRGVKEQDDGNGTVLAPARSIANTTMYGDFSRIGAGVAGDGFYFSDSTSTANSYAGYGKDLGKSAVMRAKIDKTKARTVTLSNLQNMFNSEPSSIRNAFANMSTVNDEWSTGYLGAYALKKGYNVITRPALFGERHYIVLDRSVMVMCNTITPQV